MSATEPIRFERLLFAAPSDVDPAPSWKLAAALARRAGMRVTLLGVAHEPSTDLRDLSGMTAARLEQIARDEVRERLAGLAASAPAGVEVRVQVGVGALFAEAIRAVARDCHDLVAVPSGRGALGSTAQHLIRNCPVPVWAMREIGASLPARIAVAVDGDPEAEHRALDRKLVSASVALAELCESELHVVNAFAPTPSIHTLRYRAGLSEAELGDLLGRLRAERQQWLEQLLEELASGLPRCFARVLDGEPLVEIPAQLARLSIDLLVLGTVGRSGLAGFLIGNTAEDILRRVDCSVLALKPDGFEGPIALP